MALAAWLTVGGSAAAKPPKAETKDVAAARLEKKALQVYVSGDAASATRMIEHALQTCQPPSGCTPRTRAHLLVSLGTVLGAGKGDYSLAKQQFALALTLDPDTRLNSALTNPSLTSTFEEARREAAASDKPAGSPDKTSPDKTTPEKTTPERPLSINDLFHPPPEETRPAPPPVTTVAAPPVIAKEGPEPRKNWLSVRAIADFAFLSDANICSPGTSPAYACSELNGGARYTRRPQPNDDVSPGFAPSTGRLVLGYERLLFAGFTAGAFAGYAFAFSGAPEGRSALLPVHLEARATYTFGESPYLDSGPQFHPFVFLALGMAEIDSTVVIRAYESPCGSRPAPACKVDLEAHRRDGLFFTTLGGGVRMRIEGRHALRAGARMTAFFGEGTFVLSPELAYEMGL